MARFSFLDGTAVPALQLNSLLQNGDAIDASIIGATTPAAGSFTTLTVTGSAVAPTVATSDNSTKVATTAYVTAKFVASGAYTASAVAITGGTINGTVIGGTTPAAATFTNLSLTGTATAVTQTSTDNSTKLATTAFVQTVASGISGSGSSGAATITSGTINNTSIGSTTPSTAAFTTLSVSGTSIFPTQASSDNSTKVATTAFVARAITSTGSVNSAQVVFTGGTIDNVTIGGSTAASGKFTNLTYTGALTENCRMVTVAGNIVCGASDTYILIAKTVAAATQVTLPPATLGRRITIIDTNGVCAANNITVVTSSGNINGNASVIMNVNYDSYDFISNGTNWNLI